MATINYTIEQNVAAGYVKIQWDNLTAGDVGQAFACAGLRIATIHNWGAFSGSTLFIEASNELSPANFVPLIDFSSGGEINDPEDRGPSGAVGSIRPSVSGGGGTISTAILLLST